MQAEFIKALGARLCALVSSLATGLLTLHFCSQFLTPEQYGAILVALTILTYLPFLDGGFRTSINRLVLGDISPGERLRWLQFGQSIYFYFALGALVAGSGLMAIYALTPIAQSAGERLPFYLFFALAGTGSMFATAQLGLLIGLRAQSQVYLLSALSSWIALATLVVGFSRGWNVWALPAGTLAGVIVVVPLAIALARRKMPELSFFPVRWGPQLRARFHELKDDALNCFRSQVSIMLLFSVDLLIVGFVCGPLEAGVYGVLTRMYGIVRGMLQASGEVSWPLIAQKTAGAQFAQQLLRCNAWIYGGVLGALLPTLLPLLAWLMGPEWIAPHPKPLLALVTARFLISGLSSPAAYALIGFGEFRALARFIERELGAAVLLAVPLGFWLGTPGVAAAFVIASLGGTLTPIMGAFARRSGLALGPLLLGVWARALAALAISFALATLLMGGQPAGPRAIYVGATAAALGIVSGLLFSYVRLRQQKPERSGLTVQGLIRYI